MPLPCPHLLVALLLGLVLLLGPILVPACSATASTTLPLLVLLALCPSWLLLSPRCPWVTPPVLIRVGARTLRRSTSVLAPDPTVPVRLESFCRLLTMSSLRAPLSRVTAPPSIWVRLVVVEYTILALCVCVWVRCATMTLLVPRWTPLPPPP